MPLFGSHMQLFNVFVQCCRGGTGY